MSDPLALNELETLLQAIPAPALMLSADGVLLRASAAAAEVLGLDEAQLVGRSLLDLAGPGDDVERLLGEVCDARPDGPDRVERAVRLRHATGHELYALACVRPLFDGERLTGALMLLLDLGPHLAVAARRLSVKRPPARTARAPRRTIGDGPAMTEALRRIGLAARSDVTVLLTGESGTGKELAASAIHALSERRDRAFLSVNCSAIPEPLLESELFGHVRGAFTGAVRDKVGLFQAAEGGTLFLDEVGELSPLMQVKLMRALQERELRRVGDERSLTFDARIISATNRDLRQLIASGAYREDFYYRIRVFEIKLPPLRERREDVPLLIEHFVRELNELHGKAVAGVSEEALEALCRYAWPGNIRQLRNAVEHAFVTVEGERILASDLPDEVLELPGATPSPLAPGVERRRRLKPLEEAEIREALRLAGGKKSHAAKALGVSRVTLWKKLRELGLHDELDEGAEGAEGADGD